MKNSRKMREKEVEFAKRRLMQNSFPRLQISVILLFTALAGFLASFSLLNFGVSSMALRYPLVIALAYCVFLLLLRIWLWLQNSDTNSIADLSNLDFGDFSDSSTNDIETGFNFDGGGAGGSWDGSVSSSGGNSVLDGLSFDLEEIGMVILAVAAIVGGLLASFYIIYIAPILLAELLVDGVLITGLYNRVKKIERRYWLETAVKKTLLPAILAALFFGVAGFALQKIAPEAHSVGEILHQLSDI